MKHVAKQPRPDKPTAVLFTGRTGGGKMCRGQTQEPPSWTSRTLGRRQVMGGKG